MKSILVSIVAAVVLVGCGSEPDHSGTYILTIMSDDISLELKPDGSFIGTPQDKEDDRAIGSWKVEGDFLVCEGTTERRSEKISLKFNKSTGKLISLGSHGRDMPIDDVIPAGADGLYVKKKSHGSAQKTVISNDGKTAEELKAEGKKNDPKQPGPAKEGKKLWAKSFLNKKAPELIVEKWLSEKPEWKGKFLLVDFWATWCGPCLKAIPELNRFHEQFGEQMVVVGLSDEQESKVASMKQPQIEYYSAIDTQKRMKNEVKVTGIPHVMIIDPQGIVRWEGFPFLSGHELTEEVVENLLRKHGGKTAEELKAEGK